MNRDRVAGLVILLLCSGLFYEGLRYPPDSRLYPLALLLFLMAGAVVMIVRGQPTAVEEQGRTRGALAAFAACTLYVVLVEPLGYFPATALFMAALMALMGLRRPITYVVAIGGINIALYLLFVSQLRVPVPAGLLLQ